MIKSLILINIIVSSILIFVLIIEKYPQKLYRKFENIFFYQKLDKPHLYSDNPSFSEQTSFYNIYPKSKEDKNIVMLGTSLTFRMNWNELFDRNDILNRGVGSDITGGFVKRMNFVIDKNPKICFIEGGLNDVLFDISKDTIINNLDSVINLLIQNKIKPVIHTVTYASNESKNSKAFNRKIDNLNKQILIIAKNKNIDVIDLNKLLSDGNYLRKEFATKDGFHLTENAYIIWKEEIEKILIKEKLL